MSQVAPARYFADTVVVLTDEQTRKPVLAVVIKANKVPRAILVVICISAGSPAIAGFDPTGTFPPPNVAATSTPVMVTWLPVHRIGAL